MEKREHRDTHKINRLKLPQHIAIADKVRMVCAKGEDGFAHYADEWDDAKVAETFTEFKCEEIHVSNVRKQLIGHLPKGGIGKTRPVNEAELTKRVNDLDYFLRAVASHLGMTPTEIMNEYETKQKQKLRVVA